MREKKSLKRKVIAGEEAKRSGATWANEGKDDNVGGQKQATLRGEHHFKGAFKPVEGQSTI